MLCNCHNSNLLPYHCSFARLVVVSSMSFWASLATTRGIYCENVAKMLCIWNVFCCILLETRTTFETPKYPRRPRDQYTAQIVNTLELSAPHQNWVIKNPLQPGNQPGEASNNKYMYICSSTKWSQCETVALWNSLGTCKTGSIHLRCHWKPNCQRRSSQSLVPVLLIPLVCHVHLHQYSWFGLIFSAVANRYRKSASLVDL